MNTQTTTPIPATEPGLPTSDARLEARLRRVLESGPDAFTERICQLDREWTVGRAVKVTTAVLILAGLALGVLVNHWWLVLAAVGGLALMQYLFARWSFVGELFHQFGLRTGGEIDQEKTALKALRGDFQALPTVHQVEDPDAIARLEGEGGIVAEPDESKVAPDVAVKEVIGATRR
jgi:hypothetical protein